MSRAQSVISEIVAHLERQGLLEREDDPADRRRTLVWLTAQGHEALRRDREVLSVDQLARALARLPPGQADDLIAGRVSRLTACPRSPDQPPSIQPQAPARCRRSPDAGGNPAAQVDIGRAVAELPEAERDPGLIVARVQHEPRARLDRLSRS